MLSKFIRILSRLIIGALFTFSGFVKAVDPLGFTYKITDYFEAFGILWLSNVAFVLAIIVISFELVLGFVMLLGIRVRQASWFILLFMSFFLVLTLVIAITNPVTDCGCFGDALIISNWQTFWKNVIFMVPTIVIFSSRRWYVPLYRPGYEKFLVFVFIIVAMGINLYSYRNLPIIDFRPYKTGTYIPDGMEIPEGAPMDEYEYKLTYQKDGVQQVFNEKTAPYGDSLWQWVNTETILVKKGYEPPIHDFSISDLEGYEYTEEVLTDTNYTFLFIAYSLPKANIEALNEINNLALKVQTAGHRFMCVTSSTNTEIKEIQNSLNPNYDFYLADEITLKTIIRANPGLVLIKEGVILGKWHYRNIPDIDSFDKSYMSTSTSYLTKKVEKYKTLLLFAFITILVLLYNLVAPKGKRWN